MKKISEEEKFKITAFAEAVDDMINGKFILADIKISKILKAIAQSKELYNLLAECLLNFNFEREFELAKNNGYGDKSFKMPDESYKKIAFVFCFLVEVDNKKIAFYDFINSYFTSNNTNEYKNFAEQMLLPFKNEILNRFDFSDESELVSPIQEVQATQVKDIPQKSKKNNLESLEGQILSCIGELKMELELTTKIKENKKVDILQYLNAIVEAVKIKNMKIINALLIALDKEICKLKPLKEAYSKFTSIIIKLY